MTVLFIILAIIAVVAILLWVMVIFSNEVQNNEASDAFTPVWMTFLFLTVPFWGLVVLMKKFNIMDIPLWTVIAVTLVGLILAYFSAVRALKNHLHAKEEFLKSQKLKIDSEYKKRFEVIPNLVKVIKSFTENENRNIEKVLENREKTMQFFSENNKKQLDQSVNVLLHSAYDYPALQNMPLYRSLTATLVNTQENIVHYSSEYNAAASRFNADLKSFPTSLFNRKMGFKLAEYVDENVTADQKNAETLLKDL